MACYVTKGKYTDLFGSESQSTVVLELTENFHDAHFAARKTINNRDEPGVPALELFTPVIQERALIKEAPHHSM